MLDSFTGNPSITLVTGLKENQPVETVSLLVRI